MLCCEGVGAKHKHEDNWLENQAAFDDLLATLNTSSTTGVNNVRIQLEINTEFTGDIPREIQGLSGACSAFDVLFSTCQLNNIFGLHVYTTVNQEIFGADLFLVIYFR